MNREQMKCIRIALLFAWMVVFVVLLISGCTAGMLGYEDTDEQKHTISFAPMQVSVDVETRSATPFTGTMRLLVYNAGANPTSATPVANCTFKVAGGIVTQVSPAEELSLFAGEYDFYALSDSTINPNNGKAYITHGVDLLASLTKVTIKPTGTNVTLVALSHKASKVTFTISKATQGASFTDMELPTLFKIFSQAVSPATFTLGQGGGSLSVAAGNDILPLTPKVANTTTYYAEQVLLPKPSGDFKIHIQMKLKVNGVLGVYNLLSTAPAIAFEPGKQYNYTISVKDPREMMKIKLDVTPWNKIPWNDYPYDGGAGFIPEDPDEDNGNNIEFK